MIKLAKILNEQRTADIAYHVAEEDVEESIEKYGLDPKKYDGDITTIGIHIYVFLDYDEAVGYAETYNSWLVYQGESKKTFDIWEINTKGFKLSKDYDLNTGGDPMEDSAYMIEAPINKNRLKLIHTVQ